MYPTGRDFWVAYKGQHTEPTFHKDEGDGQGPLRQIAYNYVKQWRGCIDAGANVGMWTRNLMNDFDTVHCFEPNPVFVEPISTFASAITSAVSRSSNRPLF